MEIYRQRLTLFIFLIFATIFICGEQSHAMYKGLVLNPLERNLLICLPKVSRKVSHNGTLRDHDWFTAQENPKHAQNLRLNDYYHTNDFFRYMKLKMYKHVITEENFTLEKWPNHPRALLYIGIVARVIKRPRLAIGYFQKALNLYPQYALTHAQFGKFLVEIGKVDEGIERLNIALKLDPELSLTHAGLALAYEEKGDRSLALQEAKRAKELGYKGELSSEIE